jgi:hypothetical protein
MVCYGTDWLLRICLKAWTAPERPQTANLANDRLRKYTTPSLSVLTVSLEDPEEMNQQIRFKKQMIQNIQKHCDRDIQAIKKHCDQEVGLLEEQVQKSQKLLSIVTSNSYSNYILGRWLSQRPRISLSQRPSIVLFILLYEYTRSLTQPARISARYRTWRRSSRLKGGRSLRKFIKINRRNKP